MCISDKNVRDWESVKSNVCGNCFWKRQLQNFEIELCRLKTLPRNVQLCSQKTTEQMKYVTTRTHLHAFVPSLSGTSLALQSLVICPDRMLHLSCPFQVSFTIVLRNKMTSVRAQYPV